MQFILHCATCGNYKLVVTTNVENDTLSLDCPECLKPVTVVSLPKELKEDVTTKGCHECGCGKAH